MTKESKIEKTRCNKFGDMPDGRHVMDVENADLNVAELRIKHGAIIEHHNDLTQDAAVEVRRELIKRVSGSPVMDFSHCQSCGMHTQRTARNEGYSECCNELIVDKCDANHCFHLV